MSVEQESIHFLNLEQCKRAINKRNSINDAKNTNQSFLAMYERVLDIKNP